MKVLMTADTIGGVWSYVAILCRALQTHNVEVALATMGRPLSNAQWQQIRTLENVTVYESNYRLCWMKNCDDDIEQAAHWLKDLENKLQPDLVHLNDFGHGGINWDAPVLLVAHSCVFSWWSSVKGTRPPEEEWQNYKKRVVDALRRADLLVTPTRAMRAGIVRHYGKVSNATVIANGTHFPATSSSPHDLPNRQGEKCIFSAGRIWDEAKNIAMLAEVADDIPWPIYVAGEQKDPDGGDAGLAINGLGMLDPNQMQTWLKRATIFVAPAKYEPFGLAILEAARAGCALVLSDINSLREVWGNAAVYVPPDDIDALRNALNTLIQQPGDRRQLSIAAWRRSLDYTAERMAAAYFEKYRWLAGCGAEQENASEYTELPASTFAANTEQTPRKIVAGVDP